MWIYHYPGIPLRYLKILTWKGILLSELNQVTEKYQSMIECAPVNLYLNWHTYFLKILLIFKEMGREKGRERNIDVWDTSTGCLSQDPTRDLARNLGICPDWEPNWQPFGSQPVLNPLSHTSQGYNDIHFIYANAWEGNGGVIPNS